MVVLTTSQNGGGNRMEVAKDHASRQVQVQDGIHAFKRLDIYGLGWRRHHPTTEKRLQATEKGYACFLTCWDVCKIKESNRWQTSLSFKFRRGQRWHRKHLPRPKHDTRHLFSEYWSRHNIYSLTSELEALENEIKTDQIRVYLLDSDSRTRNIWSGCRQKSFCFRFTAMTISIGSATVFHLLMAQARKVQPLTFQNRLSKRVE